VFGPLEYGITPEEKVSIATKIARPLIQKFLSDIESGLVIQEPQSLRSHLAAIEGGQTPLPFKGEVTHKLDSSRMLTVKSVNRMVRSRLYFSSESHLHAFLSILRFTIVTTMYIS
jgi:hypothetical protein